MQSLIGNIEAKLDPKGRAFLPAQLRKQCEGVRSFVLRKSLFQKCLVIYPDPVWEEMIEVLRKRLSKWNRRDDSIFRQFVSEADRIELEDNGRFLIPRRHIDELQLNSGLRFIGCDNTIEIWPIDGLSESFTDGEDFAAEIERLMSDDLCAL